MLCIEIRRRHADMEVERDEIRERLNKVKQEMNSAQFDDILKMLEGEPH